jgi:hypothetical protein
VSQFRGRKEKAMEALDAGIFEREEAINITSLLKPYHPDTPVVIGGMTAGTDLRKREDDVFLS